MALERKISSILKRVVPYCTRYKKSGITNMKKTTDDAAEEEICKSLYSLYLDDDSDSDEDGGEDIVIIEPPTPPEVPKIRTQTQTTISQFCKKKKQENEPQKRRPVIQPTMLNFFNKKDKKKVTRKNRNRLLKKICSFYVQNIFRKIHFLYILCVNMIKILTFNFKSQNQPKWVSKYLLKKNDPIRGILCTPNWVIFLEK